ncbi:MAG: hypothetical protein COB36_05250 [Alphaproteobacteria bacterium]|nr:MAG: hypothetical protein COB36_05250 [Alphaproteobacteria bacterium]
MKRTVSVVFAILILCLAGIMLAPAFIDFSVYKEQAVREVEARTGLTLQIDGDVEFSILPAPRFSVSDVSLRAPKGSKREYLAQFARLDVHVALAPLFQGQVSVSSVTLVKPVIALEMLESGQMNVLTQEIQAILAPKEAKGSSSSSSSLPDISLEKIRIKDGSFSYIDHKSVSDITIQNINMDLSAQSLLGPYQAQGSLFYDGYALNFEFESDAYDAENKILSPKIKLALQPGDLILEYGGVVNMAEEFSVQGQTSLRIENIGQTLSRYGVQNVNGLNTSLETKGLLSADATKLDYKNFDVQLGQDKASGSVRIDFAPFKYNISLKSSGDINFEDVAKGLLPFKKGSFDLAFFGNATEMTLKKTTLKLDKHVFNVSANYKVNNKTSRPEIGLNIKSTLINYDEIAAGFPKTSSSKQSVPEMISSLALPVDLSLDLSADKVIWQKRGISGLGVSAKFSRNALILSGLSVKNIAGASLKASGAIKNISNASGITAYVDMNSPDIHKVAQWFSINSDEWPKNLKKANVKAKFSGAIDLMDVTANISAMGGEVIARGKVSKALEKPVINDLVLQIKHRNMSDAVKILTGAVLNDKSLEKSLDIYARVNQTGQRYGLKEIKGDLSGISVQGDIELNLGGSVPKLKGALVFDTVNLASIMTSNGKKSSGSHNNTKSGSSSARWSKAPIDTSVLHAVNIDLALRAKKIEYGAWPLINPSLTLNLNNGVLKIDDLKAGLFGGDINFSAMVQSVAKQRQPVHFESKMSVKNANLGRLSAALLGKKLLKVSGTGDLNMNLKSAGASPAALIHDLGGQGEVTGRDIVLDGVDVERFARALSEDSKAGDTILGLWNGAKKGGTSRFDTLDGAFTIKEGVVHLNKMDLNGARTAVETRGIINLPNWTLATKHKIIVKGTEDAPSDVPPFEISFNGSLDNPAQTFGQGLLQDYLNRKIQRKFNEFLSKKLGLPSNDNTAPTNSPQQNQNTPQNAENKQPQEMDIEDAAEDAIRGILEGLLR